MSSTPLATARSTSAPTASKRLSLNVSVGPRPLHLVDGNVPSLNPGPATAPLSPSYRSPPYLPSPPSSSRNSVAFKPNPRRQSSISYRPNTDDVDVSAWSPRGGSQHALTRSFSEGLKSGSPVTSPRNRRSAGYEANATQDRPPLTVAEKHSELLHSIAQKESKCLELRSQLAIHEAELVQLKQKWERIVNRGFLDGTSSPSGQGSSAVLEGIREGVQGVSRFFAAGLAIGELSTASASSLTQLPKTLPPTLRPTHANTQSNSSASTSTTKSTRFSQSSASSVGEEFSHLHEKAEEQGLAQILMVHDTGATPTMSPNPAFEHQRRQLELRTDNCSQSTRSSFETEKKDACWTSSKMHRRKSRDAYSFEGMLPLGEASVSPPKAVREQKMEAAHLKRASINGPEFPPVSSIPGLASLTVGVASPPVASWVGSVGKKWEELQRSSTFSKNQKRASVLLSDVSQSIVSALSPSNSISTSQSSSPMPPLYSSPSPTTPLTSSTVTISLLDDDDLTMPTSCIMTPDPTPCPKSDHTLQQLQPTSSTTTRAKLNVSLELKDDEDEWNW